MLSEQDIIDIRKLYASGECTQIELAKKFKTSQSTISKTVSYRAFRNIILVNSQLISIDKKE